MPCPDNNIRIDDKYFCCSGCKFVYELLLESGLKEYYNISGNKGLTPKQVSEGEYSYLDDMEIADKLLNYNISGISNLTLSIPQIYCSACIWLLENLFRLDCGISESKVNFLKRELTVSFKNNLTSVRKIVELLVRVGYTPNLTFDRLDKRKKTGTNKTLYLKLGAAGFGFGNIMLLALPEYFSSGTMDAALKQFLTYCSLVLSFVVLYAGSGYFQSAYRSLKLGNINIDVPLALGILVLELRSGWDILTGSGPGYFDSMSGLVFLLLLGKVFQQKTFHSLAFDRDFKSYFPLSVIRKSGGNEEFISLKNIKQGDILVIRNNELIPVDCRLGSESALIDYSFVTGETAPLNITKNGKIYSGSKLIGKSIEIEAIKEFNQSYITQLWNNKAFSGNKDSYSSKISDTIARYFTIFVLVLAVLTLVYHLINSPALAWNSFTAILVIACPCAIALTLPYTYGTVLRIFSRNNFFLRNNLVVELLSKTNAIIYDKTGTLTDINKSSMTYWGKELTEEESTIIRTVAKNSTHPFSRLLASYIPGESIQEIKYYIEYPGKGIEAVVEDFNIRLGSYDWLKTFIKTEYFSEKESDIPEFNKESSVYVSIDNKLKGCFFILSKYRDDIDKLIGKSGKYVHYIISGDNENEKPVLQKLFGNSVEIKFNQLPEDKINFVNNLQNNGKKVLMVGDGLNDAGALQKSDVGIAVTDSTSNFTPGSDAILHSDSIRLLPKFLKLTGKAFVTVLLSYGISIIYNGIGFYFAIRGDLSPLVAAILMPVSSISIMLFTVSKTLIDAWMEGLR